MFVKNVTNIIILRTCKGICFPKRSFSSSMHIFVPYGMPDLKLPATVT